MLPPARGYLNVSRRLLVAYIETDDDLVDQIIAVQGPPSRDFDTSYDASCTNPIYIRVLIL